MNAQKGKSRKSTNVLLIDDDDAACFMMSEMLDILNCKVDVATCVEDAVIFSRKNTYDFYLVDIILNEKSGFDAIKDMNIDNISKKVIIVSATVHSMNMDSAMEMGIKKFLPKPVKFEELEKLFTDTGH